MKLKFGKLKRNMSAFDVAEFNSFAATHDIASPT
jgi:hypothetical protein